MYAITAERRLLFTMKTRGLKSLCKAHTNSRPPAPLACPLPQPGLHPTNEGPTSTWHTRLHLCLPGGIPPCPQLAATALGQNCIYQNVTGLHLLKRKRRPHHVQHLPGERAGVSSSVSPGTNLAGQARVTTAIASDHVIRRGERDACESHRGGSLCRGMAEPCPGRTRSSFSWDQTAPYGVWAPQGARSTLQLVTPLVRPPLTTRGFLVRETQHSPIYHFQAHSQIHQCMP
ncbi:uncharacterized protein ACIBXB_016830 isoform 1-T1 [Morphnus guianensis]